MSELTDRLRAYNGGTFDDGGNPRGLAGIGGMDANFAQALNDVGEAADHLANAGDYAVAAADSAAAAAASASVATAEANRAQAVVDGIGDGPVTSVNGLTGVVTLTPASVGAVASAVVGVANGVAGLGADGRLTAAVLPTNLGTVTLDAATVSGDLSVGGRLNVPQEIHYTLARYSVGQATVGASHTLDPAAGEYQALTLNDDTVVTLPDPPAGHGYAVTLKLIQDATGGRSPTFLKADATAAVWLADAPPVWKTAAGARDVVVLTHDGTDLLAAHVGGTG